MTHQFEIDPNKLTRYAADYKSAYESAPPFPHVVIDNFAETWALESVLNEFPSPEAGGWEHMYDKDQNKFASNDTSKLGTVTRHLLQTLNGREILNFLTELTGIEGLVPDPHLAGGGLHEIRRGGMLRVHADFNFHRQIRLDRRINLLLYLNKEWEDAFGGHLELWDTEMKGAQKKIAPIFNRCVIFNTTDNSYHGHPEPLNCPADRTRRSIAMYYYTNGRPAAEVDAAHGTLFKKRPGEGSAAERRKDFVRSLVPPVLWDLGQRVRQAP